MEKSKLAIILIIAFTITNITNITLCNAIEVIQQNREEYLLFEPDGPNEKKVKILGDYVFSQDKSWALMTNPEINDGYYLKQVQIFNETGNVTGTFMR